MEALIQGFPLITCTNETKLSFRLNPSEHVKGLFLHATSFYKLPLQFSLIVGVGEIEKRFNRLIR